MGPLDPDDSVAAGLSYPPREEPDFSDVVVPRLGAEFRVVPQLALRAGVAYRASPAPIPDRDMHSNVLDGNVTTASIGAGYRWLSRKTLQRTAGSSQANKASVGVVDFHVRLHRMNSRAVTKAIPEEPELQFQFGGWMFDAGVALRLGW